MLESIRGAFSTGASSSVLFLLVLGFVLLVLLIVWFEIRKSHYRRYARDSLSWEKFREKAERLRLTSPEIEFLSEIIQESGKNQPDAVLNSATLFEKVLETYYESRGLDRVSDVQFAMVRMLRERLGYNNLSNDVPYVSSRQFHLHARAPALLLDDSDHKWMASITSVSEKEWAITRPEGPNVPAGTRLQVNITRPGDAEYKVRTQVLQDTQNELRLVHTRDLVRNQLRNWVRIDVDLPVRALRVMPGDGLDRVEEMMLGRIRDLSGGGVSLTLSSRLPMGALLDLEFELPSYGAFKKLRVKIVRVQESFRGDDSKILHSACFEGDFKAAQERIILYVFEKQRQEARLRYSL